MYKLKVYEEITHQIKILTVNFSYFPNFLITATPTNFDNNNQIKNKNVLITTQTEVSTLAVLCSTDQKNVCMTKENNFIMISKKQILLQTTKDQKTKTKQTQ